MNPTLKLCFLAAFIGLGLLLVGSAGSSVSAQSLPQPALWTIGKIDGDDKDLALAPNGWGSYKEDAIYSVGRSQPGADWPYVMPGPEDGWGGSVPHTAEIYFPVARTPQSGTCRLTLSFVDTQFRVPPQLRITINGQSWTRDTAIGSGGDDALSGKPASGKPSEVSVDFPARLLNAGLNTVKISSIKGSWLVYDAVTLTAPAEVTLGNYPATIQVRSAEWLRDVLKRQGTALEQVLRVQVINFGPTQQAELRVSGEAPRTITVPGGRSSVEVSFPESQTARQTQVQLLRKGQPGTPAITAERLPCRRYTIYSLQHSHTDIGYNYLQAEALARHQSYLEEGLALNAASAGLPTDDRFRWNLETLYEADDWLKKATPAQVAAFQKAAQTGNLGLDALYCNELTGLCRPEELVSLLACAQRLRQQYHVPIDAAMISDVPGYTWGLVPVLAQGGVKYLSWAPNGGDHLGYARDFDNRAFYWKSPSGKDKVLVWQSPNSYYQVFDDNETSLTDFMKRFAERFPNNPYDMIYERHTLHNSDNAPADKDLAPFVHRWNAQYAYPHLVISTTSRMFHDFEARYGKTLPTLSGDYTGYWEDGAASSANETAASRTAAERTAQSEVLWSMLNPTQYPKTRFEDAWKNALLYDEHTWGAASSWDDPEGDFTTKQWAWKRQYALDAQSQSQSLQSDALRAVAATGASDTIAVFNTCSWPRTDLVILPAAQSKTGDIVRTAQGAAVPSQRLSDGTLAFLAQNIPAMASRRFTIIAGKSAFRGQAKAAGDALTTRRMSLRLDPETGAITSWNVKGIAQDLVSKGDTTCRGLNDYLYVLGGDNSKVQYASGAQVTVVDAGPLVASVRVDSLAPGARSLSSLIRVVDGLDQIQLTDTLDKTQVHEEEAVHLGFSFNVPGSTVRMDMPWSVVRPDTDQMVNANKTVFPVGRWADVSNSASGVTCANLDTPMLQIGEITLPRENAGGWLRTAKTGSTLYWNAMNNYWHTNYKAYQPGPATFRYTLRAHGPFDQADAQHFGIGQSQPLLCVPVPVAEPDVQLPLTLSNDAVLVSACHPLPDGGGWLIRLFNGSDHAQSVSVGWGGSKNLRLARTDLWGGGGQPVAPSLSLAPLEMITLRVIP